jgi:PAS domain S-box-containing protein
MKTLVEVDSSTATDAGAIRQTNEDSLGVRLPSSALERVQKGSIWVIADGVGTQGRGLQASRLAVNSIVERYWTSAIPEPVDRLRHAIEQTNTQLCEQGRPGAGPGEVAGATVLAGIVLEDRLIIAHAGRSRAYLYRNGDLRQLTDDHTWVADRIRAGELDLESAATHPRRNVITRCLGIKPSVRVDMITEPLHAGDYVILCSDGLHRQVNDAGIARIVTVYGADAAPELVNEANRLGGQDNITTVVIGIRPAEDQRDQTFERLALLNRIGRELALSLHLDATLESVTEQLIAITGGDRGAVLLLDESGNLTPRAAYNMGHGQLGGHSSSVTARALSERKPVIVADALDDPYLNTSESIVDLSLRSIICVPMIVKEDAIGVLYVDSASQSGVFNEMDVDLVVSFAGIAATAIENARLHETIMLRTRELELSRARQDSLVRSLSSGLIALDNEGIVTHWNPAAAEILGVPAPTAIGRRIQDLLSRGLSTWLTNLAMQAEIDTQTFMMAHEWDGPVNNRDRAIIAGRVGRIRDLDGSGDGTVFILNDRTDVVLLDEARRKESAERERLRELFRRYLAPPVVERLLNSPEAVKLGGSRQDVCILFADVRGFTGFSEQNTPEEVVTLLNHYLALATQEIFNEFGTLDKFIGDGVMAIFGAPVPVADREMAAVRAALSMRDNLDRLRSDTGVRVGFGVGLNAGSAIVGNIGTSQLMNYTAIGDVVNVAARLQAEARSGEILVSEAVLERVSAHVQYEELGQVYVKGRAVPVMTYKLLGLR